MHLCSAFVLSVCLLCLPLHGFGQTSTSAPPPDVPDAPSSQPRATTATNVTITTQNGTVLRPEPERILKIVPNFRSVSAGAAAPPDSAKLNFRIATEQVYDYSSLALLGISTLVNEGRDLHPTLGKGPGGYGQYLWRNALDRTDRSYQINFLFPSLLHQDPRYYAMERGNVLKRLAYAATRVVITRTYGGRETFNLAGVSGRVGSEAVARTFYPHNSSNIADLFIKFGYASARAAGSNAFREFYPDLAAHFRRHHPVTERVESGDEGPGTRPGALHPTPQPSTPRPPATPPAVN